MKHRCIVCGQEIRPKEKTMDIGCIVTWEDEDVFITVHLRCGHLVEDQMKFIRTTRIGQVVAEKIRRDSLWE